MQAINSLPVHSLQAGAIISNHRVIISDVTTSKKKFFLDNTIIK